MADYSLNDYDLSKGEIFQSLFASEYALRHFSQANKTSGKKRAVHTIIGAVEIIPVIGPIASILERCFVYALKGSSDIASKDIFKINVENPTEDKISTAFYSTVSHHHFCVNETKPPQFEKYGQAFIEMRIDTILPKHQKNNIDEISIDFLLGKQIFFHQTFKKNEFPKALFLPNVPYGKMATIQLTGKEKTGTTIVEKKMDLTFDSTKAYYTLQNDTAGIVFNRVACTTEQIITPPHIAGPNAYPMGSHKIEKPLAIKITSGQALITYSRAFFHKKHRIINNSQSIITLTFELAAWINDQLISISLPLVIHPEETKEMSPEFFRNYWMDAYNNYTNTPCPTDLDLEIQYIEQHAYTFDS